MSRTIGTIVGLALLVSAASWTVAGIQVTGPNVSVLQDVTSVPLEFFVDLADGESFQVWDFNVTVQLLGTNVGTDVFVSGVGETTSAAHPQAFPLAAVVVGTGGTRGFAATLNFPSSDEGTTEKFTLNDQEGLMKLTAGIQPGTAGTYQLDIVTDTEDTTQFTGGVAGEQLLPFTTQDGTLTIVAEKRGDLNGDGLVNNFDIKPFELALANPEAFAQQFPDVSRELVGDINKDGRFDNFDISPFEKLLAGGSKPEALDVPEPQSVLSVLVVSVVAASRICRNRRRSQEPRFIGF